MTIEHLVLSEIQNQLFIANLFQESGNLPDRKPISPLCGESGVPASARVGRLQQASQTT